MVVYGRDYNVLQDVVPIRRLEIEVWRNKHWVPLDNTALQ